LPSGAIEVQYVVIDGEAIHGDIDLGRAEDVAKEWKIAKETGRPPIPAGATRETDALGAPSSSLHLEGYDIDPRSGASLFWPGGVICYKLDPAIDKDVFQDAINTWQNWWQAPSGGVQIGLPLFVNSTTDPRCKNYYVNITPITDNLANDQHLGTCGGQSAIGKTFDSRGFQDTFLPLKSSACTDGAKRTMVHELGHVIGLYHEHQRPDRNTFVTVNDANILQVRKPDYALPASGPNRANGPYDLFSVMHYDGGPNGTYMTLSNGDALPVGVGTRSTPTTGDVSAVVSMYQNGGLGVTADVTTHDLQGNVTGGDVYPLANSAAAGGNNDYQVVAVAGTDQAVWYRTLPSSGLCHGWCPWTSIGGIVTSPPGLVVATGNAKTGDPGIFAIASDGQTMCMWGMSLGPYDGSWTCDGWPTAWGGPMVSGYSLGYESAPAVAYRDGTWLILAAATDANNDRGLVENVLFPDGSWDGWTLSKDSGLALGTGPAVVYDSGTDSICSFYVGTDGGIYTNNYDCSSFPEGTKPPPGIAPDTGITASSRGAYMIELFVAGNDGLIWGITHYGGWNAWKVYGGPASFGRPSTPAVAPLGLGSPGLETLFFTTTEPFGPLPDGTPFDPTHRYDDLWGMTVLPSTMSR